MNKKHLSVLVKPTHLCNLKCEYCYDRVALAKVGPKKMTLETVDKLSKMLKNTADTVNWIWHGGEPLLMDEEWYRKAHEIILGNTNEGQVSFQMQTNGYFLKDSIPWLEELGIEFGLSFDKTNDNTKRFGSEAKVEELKSLMEERKQASITVVDYESSFNLVETYEKLKETDTHTSFNVIFPTHENKEIFVDVDKYIENWEKFFTHVFWDKDSGGFEERTFLDYLGLIVGHTDLLCENKICLGGWLSINPNGDITHCDRPFPERYNFCNVHDLNFSFHEVFMSDKYKQFEFDFQKSRKYCRENCEVYPFCKGGCLADRVVGHDSVEFLNEDACKVKKAMIICLFNLVKNLSLEDMSEINPMVYSKIWKSGYVSQDMIHKALDKHN